MNKTCISIPAQGFQEFCRKHHIHKLSFFGSVLRNDFGPESDVDVLVEFKSGHVPGLALITIQDELAQLLGHQVDLVTPKFLNHRIRERVEKEAEVAYVKR